MHHVTVVFFVCPLKRPFGDIIKPHFALRLIPDSSNASKVIEGSKNKVVGADFIS